MGCVRWHQIQRYFKPSNVDEEDSLDMKGKDWWRKVDPLVTNFHDRSKKHFVPGRDVAVDELLLPCKGRSKHTFRYP